MLPDLDYILPAAGSPEPALDAGRVLIRAVQPGDAAKLARFFRELSPRSRSRRFHGGVSELPPAVVAQLARPGDEEGVGLIAVVERDGDEVIVGEARYAIEDVAERAEIRTEMKAAPGHGAEFAVAVTDQLQHCGVGTRLLRRLLRVAAHASVARLYGDVQADNKPMLALARSLGFTERRAAMDARLRTVECVLSAR